MRDLCPSQSHKATNDQIELPISVAPWDPREDSELLREPPTKDCIGVVEPGTTTSGEEGEGRKEGRKSFQENALGTPKAKRTGERKP